MSLRPRSHKWSQGSRPPRAVFGVAADVGGYRCAVIVCCFASFQMMVPPLLSSLLRFVLPMISPVMQLAALCFRWFPPQTSCSHCGVAGQGTNAPARPRGTGNARCVSAAATAPGGHGASSPPP